MLHTIFFLGKAVFPIYGRGSHLGHVISIMLINLHCLVPKTYILNLVEIGSMVSEISKY